MHIPEILTHNQLVSGGLFLGGLGGLVASLRSLPRHCIRYAGHKLTCSLELDSTDRSFPWVQKWLYENYGRKYFNKLRPNISSQSGPSNGTVEIKSKIDFNLSPSVGNALITYKGKKCLVRVSRREQQMGSFSLGYLDSISITIMGSNRQILTDLLNDAYQFYNKDTLNHIQVFCNRNYSGWNLINALPKRSKDTLFYDDSIIDNVENDVEKFLNNRQWYLDRGIPYHRGYLFYGEPGNGKTSMIHYLASRFEKNIYALGCQSIASDQDLYEVVGQIPENNIISIEDIDCVFSQGRETSGDNKHFSLSGLLNVFDGLVAKEGNIVILTTNFKDKLDKALIRPGRIDVQQYIGNATKIQIVKMLEKFFPNVPYQPDQLIIEDGTLSMSSVQEVVLSSSSPNQAIDTLNKLNSKN